MASKLYYCDLCGDEIKRQIEYSKYTKYHFCIPCKSTHPWRPGIKYEDRCKQLGIDRNKWYRDHYGY